MPAFIHDRAEHILAKNPSMPKSQAFAIATQQSHALGKTPKGYGTSQGKAIAKKKYDAPKKGYVKSPNPGNLKTPKLSDKPKTRWTGKRMVKASHVLLQAFVDERLKLAGLDKEALRRRPSIKGHRNLRKKAYAVSQYSGPLSYGPFKQESYIPPFRHPPVKTAGPPSSGKEKRGYDPSPVGNVHMPGMRKMKTPAIGLQASKNVAQIKETPPGPSIAQISKPKGYGTPLPGATKSGF